MWRGKRAGIYVGFLYWGGLIGVGLAEYLGMRFEANEI